MALKDVDVLITRETRPVTRAGFGVPLILTEKEGGAEYETYRDLDQLVEDFGEETEAYKLAEVLWSQDPAPERVAVVAVDSTTTPAGSDYVDKLEEVIDEDWYFLLATEDDTDIVKALSDYVNGEGAEDEKLKIFFTRTDDVVLAGDLKQDRTVSFYHPEADYPEGALVGRCGPEDPGTITWKFKGLEGVDPVAISGSNLADLHDPEADGGSQITYVRKLGYGQTSEGLVTSGEYVDVIRSQDWVQTRIEENIQRLLTESPKVPYDGRGIAQVVAEVESVMQEGTANGVIAVDEDGNGIWEVTAPNREDVDPEDRANRILPDVEFVFTVAGAVHQVEVRGVIQV